MCRLGGNLCFDNPSGRSCVLLSGILDKLANVIEENLNHLSSSKLWQVLPSFLHNYCHENKGCLQSIKSIFLLSAKQFSCLEVSDENLDIVENYINFLSGILQHEGKQDLFEEQQVSVCLIYLFEKFDYESAALPLVEIFQELFENEKLCKLYIDQKILDLVIKRSDGICKITDEEGEPSKDEFSEEVSTQCLDVLALISSHSSVLAEIQSDLTSIMTQWMTSPPTDHHLATAGIICGNICTSDSACLQLLTTNIPALLLSHVHINSSAKVLHAVVGCLRNLAVCSSARDQLSELGLVESASKMLVSLSQGKDHTVTPKLMSTLRLVTQGKESASLQLGNNDSLVEGVIKIGDYSLVPGLGIEAARLMSSIIRYSKDASVASRAVRFRATKMMISLLNSPHSQLINETLVALCLMSAKTPPEPEIVEQIDPEFIVTKISEILDMDETKCPKEVKYNAITLASNILKWDISSITEQMKQSNLIEKLNSFSELTLAIEMQQLLQ